MSVLDQLIAEHRDQGRSPDVDPTAGSGGPSLTEMAAGGYNHAQRWMQPQRTSQFQGQQPLARLATTFGAVEDDSPPGAPAYASGPLAVQPPRPAPTPAPRSTIDHEIVNKFSWSSAFAPPGY